jgi:drug/metabolite transporter (DMT)-like permease
MAQTSLPAPADRNFLGMALLTMGIAVFSLQDLVFKGIGPGYTVHQMVFIRSLVAMPLFAALVLYESGAGAFRTRRLGLVLVRSALMFLAYSTYYLSIVALPLAVAIALTTAAPLFIALLSGPLLGEWIGPRRAAAVLLGFVGVLILLRPGASVFEWASLLPILSALFYTFMQLIARRIGSEVSASVMNFYAMGTYVLIAGVLGLALGDGRFDNSSHPSLGFLFRAWVWPPPEHLALIAVTGLIAFAGFYCLTQAYRVAQPNVVAPFEYTGIIWGVLWGYLLWQELPDTLAFAGMSLIISAGLYIVYREARVRRRRV